jgi:hypothetical protein
MVFEKFDCGINETEFNADYLFQKSAEKWSFSAFITVCQKMLA